MRAVGRVGHQQPDAVASEAAGLGRRRGLERARQLERQRAHDAPRRHELARPVAPAGQLALDQLEQARDAVLGRRPVGDVLAGERLLVHPRAHVARVDGVDAQLRMLGGEDRGQLLERRLRGAVAAPALVGLDRRVGGDVDDRAARRRCSGSASWISASGASTLTA